MVAKKRRPIRSRFTEADNRMRSKIMPCTRVATDAWSKTKEREQVRTDGCAVYTSWGFGLIIHLFQIRLQHACDWSHRRVGKQNAGSPGLLHFQFHFHLSWLKVTQHSAFRTVPYCLIVCCDIINHKNVYFYICASLAMSEILKAFGNYNIL